MKYSEKDMASLIGEVESQFFEHLAKAEEERIEKIEQAIISVAKIREEMEAEAVIRAEDISLEKEQYNLKAQGVEESITFTTALDQALFKQAIKKLNDKKKR